MTAILCNTYRDPIGTWNFGQPGIAHADAPLTFFASTSCVYMKIIMAIKELWSEAVDGTEQSLLD